MLNELLEFEAYTKDPIATDAPKRLKFVNLIQNGFSGLERAMTIVARYCIFNSNNQDKIDKSFDDTNVREILKSWCGFGSQGELYEWKEDGTKEEIVGWKGWLDRYICQFMKESLEKCGSEIDKDISKFIHFITDDKILSVIAEKQGTNFTIDDVDNLIKGLERAESEKEDKKKKVKGKHEDIPKDEEKPKYVSPKEALMNIKAEIEKSNKCCDEIENFHDAIRRARQKIIRELSSGKLEALRKIKEKSEISQLIAELERLYDLHKIKNMTFAKGLFSLKDTPLVKNNPRSKGMSGFNDFKKITYERIIADALVFGKLKNYYLLCEEQNPFQNLSKETDKKGYKSLSDTDKGISEAKETILKVTAAYLLRQKMNESCEDGKEDLPILVNLTDIKNWYSKSKLNFSKYGIQIEKGNGETDTVPLFTEPSHHAQNAKKQNITKLGLHPQWASKFLLIEASEWKRYKTSEDEKWNILLQEPAS